MKGQHMLDTENPTTPDDVLEALDNNFEAWDNSAARSGAKIDIAADGHKSADELIADALDYYLPYLEGLWSDVEIGIYVLNHDHEYEDPDDLLTYARAHITGCMTDEMKEITRDHIESCKDINTYFGVNKVL